MAIIPLIGAILAAGTPSPAASSPHVSAAPAPAVLSPARETPLIRHLTPEKPTLFLFYRSGSAIERALADGLATEYRGKAGLEWVPLASGTEPLARQYQVAETPLALVYDRRGRLVKRTSDPAAIRDSVGRAAGVTRIDWAADDDPRMAEVEKLLGRRVSGGILRTMSQQPTYLAGINDVARKAHFTDGYLKRRTKEMIASYVSALNGCRY